MKITYNWLKSYVDFSWSPDELSQRLTMMGIEVEGMEKRSGDFENIVVAQIVSFQKHPNADKLAVCRVNDGIGERQIVCGATNFKDGDKVPLALPGCSMPVGAGEAPFVIKVGKIRGVESHGMMCSPQELKLPDQVDGLLLLPDDAKVGQSFSEFLGRSGSDVIFDLEITPNRPDLNSLIGIAREVSALTGNPLRFPGVEDRNPSAAQRQVSLEVLDPKLCPRYSARLIRGVKVGPSPDWLKNRLLSIGLRSVNNVVDITNFVLFEAGHPLHAFDFRSLQETDDGTRKIVVRAAVEGEVFQSLDSRSHKLKSSDLVIADSERPVALAGIMGGLNSEITAQTVDVLLESALFLPAQIRKTSKTHDLRSDSSYRFERGADIGICGWASRRATDLILQLAGGELVEELESFPLPPIPATIGLRPGRTSALLGVAISTADQAKFLNRLGIETVETSDVLSSKIPSFRVDLKREVDLIEEIGRMIGVDSIPATPPRAVFGRNAFDEVFDELSLVRRALTGLGLSEAQGQTLISSESAGLISAPSIKLPHPLSSDMDLLRPSLLPGLLSIAGRNAQHKNARTALFELGRVFNRTSAGIEELWKIGVVLNGKRNPSSWIQNENENFDIYDLKGILEELLENLGFSGATFRKADNAAPFFLEQGSITLGKLSVGDWGQVSPSLNRKLDIKEAVYAAELDLKIVLGRRAAQKNFSPLPAFPSIRRDIAMVVEESVTHADVQSTVKSAKPDHLSEITLFDVFRGKNIDPGFKSMAYALVYRHPEKTLTDVEVNAVHLKVVGALKEKLRAAIRE